MESRSNTVVTRAKLHPVLTRHEGKACLSKSSQILSPIYFFLAAEPCHENRNYVTRSSREPKLHDNGADATQPPTSSLPSSPSPSIERRTNNNSIHQTPGQEISGSRESLLKIGLPLLEYSLFIDAKAEPPRIQNFHICRDGLNPKIFQINRIRFNPATQSPPLRSRNMGH